MDVVCFDKTGTLTDGSINFEELLAEAPDLDIEAALRALCNQEAPNATLAALASRFTPSDAWQRVGSVAFSSATKWSAATFAGHGTWILGAPEVVLEDYLPVLARAQERAGRGLRVLALGYSSEVLPANRALPVGIRPAALLVFGEKLRPQAAQTLDYFVRQGVSIKVISGDSPSTVETLALKVGALAPGERALDAGTLPEELGALSEVLESYKVFGRVTPLQKQAMVKALQAKGHVVAMTGDGVNDTLALKVADIGVAMGSGSAATKAVAQLVLLDSDFAALPAVVAEGRRVVANIERVANLFVTKTVWAALLAILAGTLQIAYPLLPRHLTVIDALTIGIPSFFLALQPNSRRYRPGLVKRVLRFSAPVGSVVTVAASVTYLWARSNADSIVEQRTVVTLVILMVGLAVLVVAAAPLNWWKIALVALMAGGFLALFPSPSIRNFYGLSLPRTGLGVVLGVGVVAMVITAAISVLLKSSPGGLSQQSRG